MCGIQVVVSDLADSMVAGPRRPGSGRAAALTRTVFSAHRVGEVKLGQTSRNVVGMGQHVSRD